LRHWVRFHPAFKILPKAKEKAPGQGAFEFTANPVKEGDVICSGQEASRR
jgi:hypothetical protein